jgi:hypothetical protein
MHLRQYTGKIPNRVDALRPLESETLLQRIDSNVADSNVIDRDARLFGFFHGMQYIRAGILAFVTFIGG